MKITRTDRKNSMLTELKIEFEFTDEEYDNKTKKMKKLKPALMTQNMVIPTYEADLIESKIATISNSQLKEMLFKEGEKVIKE
tara:strand:+ start:570 stop:818 length:249 start_codon:yes stop_codon:yes gene_type:complete